MDKGAWETPADMECRARRRCVVAGLVTVGLATALDGGLSDDALSKVEAAAQRKAMERQKAIEAARLQERLAAQAREQQAREDQQRQRVEAAKAKMERAGRCSCTRYHSRRGVPVEMSDFVEAAMQLEPREWWDFCEKTEGNNVRTCYPRHHQVMETTLVPCTDSLMQCAPHRCVIPSATRIQS